MILTSPDGSLQIKFLVFSNKTLFGNVCGESRKIALGGSVSGSTKKLSEIQKSMRKPCKKDPEENLGNVISVLDTEKIEREVDYLNVISAIDTIMKKKNITFKDFFSDRNLVYQTCKNFELNVQELVTLMLENNPSVFTLSFIRTVIKPFIAQLMDEKYNYDNETELNKGYEPIFDLLQDARR